MAVARARENPRFNRTSLCRSGVPAKAASHFAAHLLGGLAQDDENAVWRPLPRGRHCPYRGLLDQDLRG